MNAVGFLTLVELGAGSAEKAVAAQYERVYRPPEKSHQPWIEQCEGQSQAGFEALDQMAECLGSLARE